MVAEADQSTCRQEHKKDYLHHLPHKETTVILQPIYYPNLFLHMSLGILDECREINELRKHFHQNVYGTLKVEVWLTEHFLDFIMLVIIRYRQDLICVDFKYK